MPSRVVAFALQTLALQANNQELASSTYGDQADCLTTSAELCRDALDVGHSLNLSSQSVTHSLDLRDALDLSAIEQQHVLKRLGDFGCHLDAFTVESRFRGLVP